ncbi:unnamed protein product [Arctogadus glacialis]
MAVSQHLVCFSGLVIPEERKPVGTGLPFTPNSFKTRAHAEATARHRSGPGTSGSRFSSSLYSGYRAREQRRRGLGNERSSSSHERPWLESAQHPGNRVEITRRDVAGVPAWFPYLQTGGVINVRSITGLIK